ncbi:MAG: gas vesicle protein GvpD P-loop domain-containing protein [Thermoplasmata archaeon]
MEASKESKTEKKGKQSLKSKGGMAIPPEVIDFISRKDGSSLLVKGTAGTGKTTLSLQFIEEVGDPDRSFYLSTRVSDQSLYNQFPWLEEKEMKNRIVDSSKLFLEAIYEEEEEEETELPEAEKKKLESAKKFLGSIDDDTIPTEVDRTLLRQIDRKIPDLERVYDRINSILPERTMLIIDSVEGLTHKYGLGPETFIMTLQKDLVENSNTNLILVLEKEEARELEYLVDGVVKLNRFHLENRDVREIRLLKLRGVGIQQPGYLMTLDGGRFTCFEPFRSLVDKHTEWMPIQGTEDKYSTGSKDLDILLDGGFAKGSYNVFEVQENVSTEEYFSVLRPIFLNTLSEGMGVLAILSGGTHPDNLRRDLIRFVPSKKFDSKFRIVDYFSPHTNKPYMMALGGRKRDEVGKIYNRHISDISDEGRSPILDYTGFDTLEYLMGNEIAIKDLLEAVANTKVSHNLGIGIIKHGLKLTSEIKNMSDNYFVITSINNTPCIYGIKPKTGLYAIITDPVKGIPYISLIPIR